MMYDVIGSRTWLNCSLFSWVCIPAARILFVKQLTVVLKTYLAVLGAKASECAVVCPNSSECAVLCPNSKWPEGPFMHEEGYVMEHVHPSQFVISGVIASSVVGSMV